MSTASETRNPPVRRARRTRTPPRHAPLLVLGAGGQGKVVADAAAEAGERMIAFADAKWPQITQVSVWPVVCAVAML